ncbi:RNA polymerase sigma factor [Flavilitoribacter nigricans]|nr:sigma-70 family RNA polymerase sigma factor [Flavilitoribacter nigricans]
MILAGGEQENKAIAYILKRNRKKAYHLVLQRYGNQEDAKDVWLEGVTQLVLMIEAGKFRSGHSIDALLWRIFERIWFKMLSKNNKEQEKTEKLKLMETNPDPPDLFIINQELRAILKKLSTFLGDDCFKVLYLQAQSYKAEEIREKMPQFSSAQAVMNRIYRCKQRLSKEIETNEALQVYLDQLRTFYFNDK